MLYGKNWNVGEKKSKKIKNGVQKCEERGL